MENENGMDAIDKMSLQDVETLVEKLENDLEDVVPASYLDLDPCHDGSSHESDDEPATTGYVTDSEEGEEDVETVYSGYVPSIDDYCSCGRCGDMPTKEENYCCHESEFLEELRGDYGCVIENPRFLQVVLSRESLEFNRYLFGQAISDVNQRKSYYQQKLGNSQFRHLGYKSFVSLVMSGQPLGRWRRVALPSCAVSKIRETFPDLNGRYTGFAVEEGIEMISFQEM